MVKPEKIRETGAAIAKNLLERNELANFTLASSEPGRGLSISHADAFTRSGREEKVPARSSRNVRLGRSVAAMVSIALVVSLSIVGSVNAQSNSQAPSTQAPSTQGAPQSSSPAPGQAKFPPPATPPPNRLGLREAPATNITVDGSEAMFTTMCALLAAGFEADVSADHWSAYRTQMRARMQAQQGPAVEALRKLAGHWPDKELAVSLNRMRCKTGDGETWTTVRVREMRERLGLPEYDSEKSSGTMISLGKAAQRLGICIGSAKTLALKGVLPATQHMPGAQWLVPVDALTSESVRIGVQKIIDRRPQHYEGYQYDKVIRLPGI